MKRVERKGTGNEGRELGGEGYRGLHGLESEFYFEKGG